MTRREKHSRPLLWLGILSGILGIITLTFCMTYPGAVLSLCSAVLCTLSAAMLIKRRQGSTFSSEEADCLRLKRFSGSCKDRFCILIEISYDRRFFPFSGEHESTDIREMLVEEIRSMFDLKDVYRIYRSSIACICSFPPGTTEKLGERGNHERWMINSLYTVLEQNLAAYDHEHHSLTRIHMGSASSGIRFQAEQMTDLVDLARLTVLTAKQRRVPFVIADEALRAQRSDHTEFYRALRHERTLQEFIPYFQPILSAESHKVVGCEVLARWKKDTYRIIEASQFSDLLREMNLIEAMDMLVMKKAFRTLSHMRIQRNIQEDFLIVINISAVTLKRHTVQQILHLSDIYHIPPSSLQFDIRDQSAEDSEIVRILQELRRSGCSIALDAYEKQSFNLTILSDQDVDSIKIPAQGTSDRPSRFNQMLAETARGLSMSILVKQIENLEQLHQARSMGASFIQGNYFCRPSSASDLAIFINKYAHGIQIPSKRAALR